MPLPEGSKVIGQRRVKRHLELTYVTPDGKYHTEIRKDCRCPNDNTKPCHCSK